MTKKNNIMSKGWLIIGIVLIVTGSFSLFIVNSLFTESNKLGVIINDELYNGDIEEIRNNIEMNARFLVIASLVIIIIGVIMIVESILFYRLLKKLT